MLKVEATIVIHAPCPRVARLYRRYEDWPQLFPATIRGVRLLGAAGGRLRIEVDHREGKVLNVMGVVGPTRVDLWESKRRYDGLFVNRFRPVGRDTVYTVHGEIRLKGASRLLAPFLTGYVRRQMIRHLLEPMRAAAEADSVRRTSTFSPGESP